MFNRLYIPDPPPSYYDQDGLGSVTSLSNVSGAVANTYVYDSFGNTTASTGTLTNPYHYTGRDYDPETGLRYYRARYYDSSTGRFLGEDPIGFDGGNNFYAYVHNDPTNLEDPFGLAACTYYVPSGLLVCMPSNPQNGGMLYIPVASGNNGDGSHCKNNPACQSQSGRGPISNGLWQWTNHPTTKPNGRSLKPLTPTARDLIRSHSCKNPFGPSAVPPFCSEGCVTGTPADMKRLNQLLDAEPGSILNVVGYPKFSLSN